MLRPTPLPPVPAETTRIARAAFPRATRISTLRTRSARCSPTTHSRRSSGAGGSPRWPRGGSRSRRFCNSRRGSPIARPPTRCAPGSTGSMFSAWSRPTQASTPRSCASFAAASPRAGPNGCSSRRCWRGAASGSCSRRGDGSAPTRPTCSPPSAPSTGSKSSARRCTTPSTAWPWPPPLGCAPTVCPRGATAMAAAWRMPTCPGARRRARRSPCWSEVTATRCSPRSTRPTRPPGCEKSRWSRRCAASGCSSSAWRRGRCAGARPTTSRRPLSSSARPMTLMRITHVSPPPPGSGTRSTLPRRATIMRPG